MALVRWRNLAFLCRFAHQSVYDLLGRDPLEHPLTAWESAVFRACVQWHWEAEIKARAGINPLDPTGQTDMPE